MHLGTGAGGCAEFGRGSAHVGSPVGNILALAPALKFQKSSVCVDQHPRSPHEPSECLQQAVALP